MTSIYKKLAIIQARLNVPKSLRNDYGEFNFRSCESILQAVKPLLSETETILLLSDEVVQIGERFYVKATATLACSKSGEVATTIALSREVEISTEMEPSQLTGAASSYARKYALGGLFCLDDNKDADSTSTHGGRKRQQQESLAEDLPRTSADWIDKFDEECPKTVEDIQRWRNEHGGDIHKSLTDKTELSKTFGYIADYEKFCNEEELNAPLSEPAEPVNSSGLDIQI